MRLRSALPLAVIAAFAVAAAPAVHVIDDPTDEDPVEEEALEEEEDPVEEEALDPVVCGNEHDFEVLTPGSLDVTVPAPSAFLGNERETQFFLVDLGSEEAPAFEDTTADLTGEMTWTVIANDYDMILGPVTTEAFQPLDPAVETATVTVGHCDLIQIGALDWLAPAPVEELTISTTLTRND